MFTNKLLASFAVILLAGLLGANSSESQTRFRIMAYNVEFGKNASPEEIGVAIKPYRPDIVTFSEVPEGDWTARVGKVLGLEHVHVGKISSANHKDKYKSILSLTPLEETAEHVLEGIGWNPASAVSAVTTIGGHRISVYSLHVAGAGGGVDIEKRHSKFLVDSVLAQDAADYILVTGDFNDVVGEPVMSYYTDNGYTAMWTDLGIDVSRSSPHNTWNALGTQKAGVIDHILYRTDSGMRAVAGGIALFQPVRSDHHPVWAEIEIEAAE